MRIDAKRKHTICNDAKEGGEECDIVGQEDEPGDFRRTFVIV